MYALRRTMAKNRVGWPGKMGGIPLTPPPSGRGVTRPGKNNGGGVSGRPPLLKCEMYAVLHSFFSVCYPMHQTNRALRTATQK
jgi:hypothetical protein